MSEPITDEALRDLLRLSERATPGPYEWDDDERCVFAPDGRIMFDRSAETDDSDVADATFLAAANPTTVRSLVRELLALREQVCIIGEDNVRLRSAISGLKTGSCWCDVGIGNPMMRGRHSLGCLGVLDLMRTDLGEDQ